MPWQFVCSAFSSNWEDSLTNLQVSQDAGNFLTNLVTFALSRAGFLRGVGSHLRTVQPVHFMGNKTAIEICSYELCHEIFSCSNDVPLSSPIGLF